MQDYLDSKLMRRLLRPIERPGVINTGMGWEIVGRSQQFTNRLPLLDRLTQRWNRKIGLQGDEIPIVYARSQLQETPQTGTISSELSQPPSSQRTVVQAKFVSGGDRTNQLVRKTDNLAGDTPNLQDFLETNSRGENFPSNTPTVVQAKFVSGSDRTNKLVQINNNVAGETPKSQEFLESKLRGENLHSNPTTVVQAKFVSGGDRANQLIQQTDNLAGETPNSQEFLETNSRGENLLSNPTNVVQAKLVSGSDRDNKIVQKTNYFAGEMPNPQEFLETNLREENFPSSPIKVVSPSVGWVEVIKPPLNDDPPNKNNLLGGRFAIAQPNLQSLSINGEGKNTTLGTSSSSQRTIVQAKFVSGSDRNLLVSQLTSIGTKLPIEKPIIEQNLNFSPPKVPREIIQNLQSKIQNPLATPLVFSSPAVKTESVQTELKIPNPSITGLSRTEPTIETAGLSKEVSPNIQSNAASNIQQPNIQNNSNIQNSIDLEALTDKIERKLMQRLIVESERRGKKTWS
ncbi:MAG: hypothetical protein MUE44_02700 [Oscillatoriaceae cyanobacterium Prado104]|jgi:hypothetical protein|nr:hypothetical protein [Oscillatoriaceae cyanobacterium Prado104]